MNKRLKIVLVVLVMVSIVVVIEDRMQNGEGRHKQGFYERYIKRVQDFWCSVIALIVLSPIMFVTAIFVRLKLGSPVIFKQYRPGKNGKIFQIYKFRTMTDDRDGESGELLPDKDRITDFGQALRSSSLDELPELVNIIRGDMSFVGPRPLLPEYMDRYNEEQRHRHDVKPGLTGLAQISGRNGISWKERFQDDLEYVENIGFVADWKIVFHTLGAVLKRVGISSETSVTMEKFEGNK